MEPKAIVEMQNCTQFRYPALFVRVTIQSNLCLSFCLSLSTKHPTFNLFPFTFATLDQRGNAQYPMELGPHVSFLTLNQYIEDITRWLKHMKFIFKWKKYFTSERSERDKKCSKQLVLELISMSFQKKIQCFNKTLEELDQYLKCFDTSSSPIQYQPNIAILK